MSKKIKHALILAAGFGTRLRAANLNLPKPLVDINSKAVLEITLDSFNQIEDIEDIYINLHWQAEQIKDYLAHYKSKKRIILIEERQILGTGGAVKNIFNMMQDEYLLVKNADTIFVGQENVYQGLYDAFTRLQQVGMLLMFVEKKPHERGDFIFLPDNKFIRDEEADSHTDIYTGCGIFNRKIFENSEKIFSLSEIMFRADKKLYDFMDFYATRIASSVSWFDIGTPERLSLAKHYLACHPSYQCY